MKKYSIIGDCSIRELGGKFLMMVYPGNGQEPYALQVNESFARLYGLVKDLDSFTEDYLVAAIAAEYGLSPEAAGAEAAKTLKLWEEQCLVK